ncbi:MAG: cold shock domain-containing protein [Candidatus Competibacter sp.]
METGKVKHWNEDKGYGFIITNNGEEIFVHISDLAIPNQNSLKKNQFVKFKRTKNSRGVKASHVELLFPESEFNDNKISDSLIDLNIESEDIEELNTDKVENNILHEISLWMREAKAENNDRYFWHLKEADQIKQGEKYFVIGRKGSGKTAICEFLNRQSGHNVFAEKLNFKSFPFNDLYGQKNQKYTPPNQFISIWKYLIYSTICRLMLKNESIDISVRDQLSQIYNDDTSLNRRIEKWTGNEFGISLFGLSIKLSKRPTTTPQNWIDHLNFIEDLVLQYAGEAKYYILFDELDEDYRDLVEKDQYIQYASLITSLFKAVQDIRTTTPITTNKPKLYPIVFLRDDIYEIVRDSDKNKWGDFRVDLNWDIDKIKKLIAFRISRARDASCKNILPFNTAWQMVFGTKKIGVGSKGKNKISTFDYISRGTILRPRDFVSYLQNCAQEATNEGINISPEVVKRVDKAFSNYLKNEFIDELFVILPDISNIFSTISQLRKWNFSIEELMNAYSEQVSQGFIKEHNVKYVIQTLFLFSVIGNSPRNGRYVFRYLSPEARLNFNERIVIHRGLFKALQIL